jgi:hypothetical protein
MDPDPGGPPKNADPVPDPQPAFVRRGSLQSITRQVWNGAWCPLFSPTPHPPFSVYKTQESGLCLQNISNQQNIRRKQWDEINIHWSSALYASVVYPIRIRTDPVQMSCSDLSPNFYTFKEPRTRFQGIKSWAFTNTGSGGPVR